MNTEHSKLLSLNEISNLIGLDNVAYANTEPGEMRGQVIPSIYLKPNDHFNPSINLNAEGVMILIFFNEKDILFCLEVFNDRFIKNYRPKNSNFLPLISIKRATITGFEKKQKEDYNAFNPKKSYEFANRASFGVRGIIPRLLFKTAINISSNTEPDFILKKGELFILSYLENGEPKSIEIILEDFYVQNFEVLLKKYWNNTIK